MKQLHVREPWSSVPYKSGDQVLQDLLARIQVLESRVHELEVRESEIASLELRESEMAPETKATVLEPVPAGV